MMEIIETLDIHGYHGLTLPNTFYRHTAPVRRLALLYPGRGYTCAMPVLYYPARWLFTRGADVLTIEYGFVRQTPGVSALDPLELQNWLGGDALAALDGALSMGGYNEIVLVGKSLGTVALSRLALDLPPTNRQVSFVWLTPLFKNQDLRAALRRTKPRSLFVQGDADPHFEPALFAELAREVSAHTLILPGADHSLEYGLDFNTTLQAQYKVLEALEMFTAW